MDGENNGSNPINKWMIWGETPLFLETPKCSARRSFFDIGSHVVLVVLVSPAKLWNEPFGLMNHPTKRRKKLVKNGKPPNEIA